MNKSETIMLKQIIKTYQNIINQFDDQVLYIVIVTFMVCATIVAFLYQHL
jgi:hypothetical protein